VCVEVRRICCLHREAASAHELSTAWPPYSADAEHAEADAADNALSRRMRAHADAWRAAADAYAALLLRIERLVRAHIQLPFRYVSGCIHTYQCHIQLPFRYISVYTHTCSCHFGYMNAILVYIYKRAGSSAHTAAISVCIGIYTHIQLPFRYLYVYMPFRYIYIYKRAGSCAHTAVAALLQLLQLCCSCGVRIYSRLLAPAAALTRALFN
jgi:hypothetical protein